MKLDKEIATYQRELPRLLEQEGKYVLIQGDNVLDVFSSYEDALKEGYKQFGTTTPFFVKQIRLIPQFQFITRDLSFPSA